ncbi:overexpressed in colon carcinoma 1 protein homolog isoform X2 [Cololabis saira]|uniref:overexpressed in colon carcinoma 1 protein homolog isoform X2 n=1 Tax=Cololabis saira TaxID=129043 RepID=UPI002AD4BB28|nr:overexpressed in colon carcinoma 1 protein homolog isoform X2 [Cololabis saira]
MGCGNSSSASKCSKTNSSSSSGGRAEFSSKLLNEVTSAHTLGFNASVCAGTSEDSMQEDDKRKNYGGVYVGLPPDLSSIPQVQIGPLRDVSAETTSDWRSARAASSY